MVIECTVASKFEPKCTWYKETNEVRESSRHMYVVEKTKEGEFAVKLEINEVEETDKGAYKLVASNEKGEAVSQIVHLVDIPEEEAKPTKPEISRKLNDQKVTESKSFELVVSLKQTDRKCKIEWYKGSTIVKETKDITTSFDGSTARLSFSSARVEHSSTYKVVIFNEAGKDESSCKIVVEKKEEKKKEEEEDDEEKLKVIKKQTKQKDEKIDLKIKETKDEILEENQQKTEHQLVEIKQQTKQVSEQQKTVIQQQAKQSQQLEVKVEQQRRVSFSFQQEEEQVSSSSLAQTKQVQQKMHKQEGLMVEQSQMQQRKMSVSSTQKQVRQEEMNVVSQKQQQQTQVSSSTVSQLTISGSSNSFKSSDTNISGNSLSADVTVYELPKLKPFSSKRKLSRELDSQERKVIFDVKLKPAQQIQRDEVRLNVNLKKPLSLVYILDLYLNESIYISYSIYLSLFIS